MAVTRDDLAEISRLLAGEGGEPASLADVKARFPGLVLTRVDASDVEEEPFEVAGLYDLHLMDSADHCVKITDDPEQATGLILAERRK